MIKLDFIYRPNPKAAPKAKNHAKPKAKRVPKPRKVSKRKPGRPSTGFNKREYMRLWMRDKSKADKLGLTVKEYRSRQKANPNA